MTHPTRRTPRAQLIPIDARVTFRYVTGWASEDRWEPMTLARLTAAMPVHRDEDDDGATYRHLLTFGPHGWQEAKQTYKRLLPRKERPTFVRWLSHMVAEYFAQGCRCEHDCCGHMQAYASLRYLGRRRFSVERRTYPNV